MGQENEVALDGGYVNNVVRVGDTVRRALTKPRPFARDVLMFLDAHGWPHAPRYRGIDDEGREVLSFIDGYVPWDRASAPSAIWSPDAVAAVARLARELHDLTAGSALAAGDEVICHNDLSPRNTVYDSALRPVAFVDWDLAAPGRRIHDVALICWQWVCHSGVDARWAAHLVTVVANSYGCTDADRDELFDAILWWQDRCWRGIQAGIDAGDPSYSRLEASGAVDAVKADWDWTTTHRAALERALR